MKKPWNESPAPRPADAFLIAITAFALTGLGIARLTVKLNPHLSERFWDTVFVELWFTAAYAAVGAIAGTLAAVALTVLARWVHPPAPRWILATMLVAGLGLAPLAYFLSLPNVGFVSAGLTHLLTTDGLDRAFGLARVGAALAVLGLALALALAAAAQRLGISVRRLLSLAGALTLVALMVGIGPDRQTEAPPAREDPSADLAARIATADTPPPPPVVLLCIDGADLQVIEPMIEAGELPTFARLTREGTWGSLATFEPTLSPVVWTSLITGKEAKDHGIHHFLHFRLPGVSQAIYHFPLHTGLNFRLFPLLEKIPGMPPLRTPNTSNMRQTSALWNIVGQRYPVGTYRWLISWPAEEVNGFSVAGSIGWVNFGAEARREVRKSLPSNKRGAHPPELRRLLERRRQQAPQAMIDAYVGEGYEIDRKDPLLQAIVKSHDDPTVREIPVLIDTFEARFTAAGFYSVDPFHHLYNSHRQQGGILSGAIAERYRTTDARLGELLEALSEDTQLLVVSDHGFDFENGHHTYAPPGIFFARGPAFSAGQRVDTLSVYDIAPLVLHLLRMPLADDMPGTGTGNYRKSLSDEFLAANPAEHTATYEVFGGTRSHESIESPEDDNIRDVLKSLGYIN